MLTVIDWDVHFENNRSRELKEMRWIPLPNKMDGEGYGTLVDHPNGAAHFGAWVAIVEIASRQEVRGQIKDGPFNLSHRLARISQLPAALFDEVIPRLVQIGWIHIDREIPQEGAGLPQACAVPTLLFSSLPFTSEEEKPSKKKEKRASRFLITECPQEWVQFAMNDLSWESAHVYSTFDKFSDYWKAKAGSNAVKVDWLATWRNWCRNERNGPNGIVKDRVVPAWMREE